MMNRFDADGLIKSLLPLVVTGLMLTSCTGGREGAGKSALVQELQDGTGREVTVLPFALERIKLYKDRLDSLFSYTGKSPYTLVIDTVTEADHRKITYRFRQSGRYGSLRTHFDLFEFKDELLAEEYYNDLFTKDILCPFGIDKRRQYIYQKGSLLVWHHFESSYSHKYDDIIALFKAMFISRTGNDQGRTYEGIYSYKKPTNRLKDIRGDWQVSEQHAIFSESYSVTFHDVMHSTNIESIKISGDSMVQLSGTQFYIKECFCTEFPCAVTYFKYLSGRSLVKFNCDNEKSDFIKSLQQKNSKVKEYELTFKGTSHSFDYIRYIILDNGKRYLIFKGYIYTLKLLQDG